MYTVYASRRAKTTKANGSATISDTDAVHTSSVERNVRYTTRRAELERRSKNAESQERSMLSSMVAVARSAPLVRKLQSKRSSSSTICGTW
jgi:hypothetical protein